MNFIKIVKPSKPKIKGFILFLIGMFVFKIINYLIRISLSRNLGPEGYINFIGSLTGIILYISLSLLYFTWIYILIAFIYSLAKKKN
jgi:hypothetical protein